jgi:hypothetical protein
MSKEQLMLRGTEYEHLLHGDYPRSWHDLFRMMEGLDFVVEEWRLSMLHHGLDDMAEEINTEIIAENMKTRLAIYCYLNDEDVDFTFVDVMKQFKELSKVYLKLAQSYAKTPPLSHWYANLPMRVIGSFKAIRERARLKKAEEEN